MPVTMIQNIISRDEAHVIRFEDIIDGHILFREKVNLSIDAALYAGGLPHHASPLDGDARRRRRDAAKLPA